MGKVRNLTFFWKADGATHWRSLTPIFALGLVSLMSMLIGHLVAAGQVQLALTLLLAPSLLLLALLAPRAMFAVVLVYAVISEHLSGINTLGLPGLNAQTLVVAGALVAWFGQLRRSGRTTRLTQLDWAVLVFSGMFALAAALSPMRSGWVDQFSGLKHYGVYAVVYFAARSLSWPDRSVRNLTAIYVLSRLPFALSNALTHLNLVEALGAVSAATRVAKTGVNNSLVWSGDTTFLFPMLIILIWLTLRWDRLNWAWRLSGLGLSCLFGYGILVSLFRASLVMLAIALGIVLAASRRASAIVPVALSIGILLAVLPRGMISRASYLLDPATGALLADESLANRIYVYWPVTIRLALRSLPWGVGLDIAQVQASIPSVHNEFLAWFAEIGLGVLVVIWFLGVLYWHFWRSQVTATSLVERVVALAFVAGAVGVNVLSLTQVGLFREWLLAAMVFAGILASRQWERQNHCVGQASGRIG